ncbi:MAG: hypothetical protein ACOC8A_01915 [bacterium]
MNDRDDDWDAYPSDHFDGLDRDDWDEDDWEAFLSRQDFLNAKYQELFETLRRHPDRDQLIAREMHWNLPEDLGGYGSFYEDYPPYDDELDDEDEVFLDGPVDTDAHTHEAFDTSAPDDPRQIPAYALAQSFALDLDRRITARLRDAAESDEDAAGVTLAALDVSAKIVDGHSIGYERDSLCGNIACCKRALTSLRESLDGLLALRHRRVLLPTEADELLERGRGLGEAIRERIQELRRRIWWR